MRSKLLAVLDDPPAVVDCGACPATMACAVGKGGTGWTFFCCGSTSVDEGDVLLILDCQRHQFEIRPEMLVEQACGLCSGEIMKTGLLEEQTGNSRRIRYVPTRHAKIPLGERLAVWRNALEHYRSAQKKGPR